MLRVTVALFVSLGLMLILVACTGGGGSSSGGGNAYLSDECKDAIYANFRLSNADSTRRFYVGTKLKNWNQAQLAAAIDEGGYLEVWPKSGI